MKNLPQDNPGYELTELGDSFEDPQQVSEYLYARITDEERNELERLEQVYEADPTEQNARRVMDYSSELYVKVGIFEVTARHN